MAIDLAVMRKRLEEKQAEIQRRIAALTGSPAPPEDAIQASDGVVEPEEEAVDLQETDVDQAILDNEKALLAEVQQALARIHPLSLQEAWAHLPSFGRQSSSGYLPPDTGQLVRVQNIAYCFDFPVQNVERYH